MGSIHMPNASSCTVDSFDTFVCCNLLLPYGCATTACPYSCTSGVPVYLSGPFARSCSCSIADNDIDVAQPQRRTYLNRLKAFHLLLLCGLPRAYTSELQLCRKCQRLASSSSATARRSGLQRNSIRALPTWSSRTMGRAKWGKPAKGL